MRYSPKTKKCIGPGGISEECTKVSRPPNMFLFRLYCFIYIQYQEILPEQKLEEMKKELFKNEKEAYKEKLEDEQKVAAKEVEHVSDLAGYGSC